MDFQELEHIAALFEPPKDLQKISLAFSKVLKPRLTKKEKRLEQKKYRPKRNSR